MKYKQSKFIQNNTHHKLIGKLYNEKNNDERIFKMFKDTFNSNNFGKEFERYGGVPPPPEVTEILNHIMGESSKDTNKDIGIYISTHMKRYIHNRVGTYLKESEISNKKENEKGVFKKGDIVVCKDSNGSDRFVLVCKEADKDLVRIITKNENENLKSNLKPQIF